MIRQMRTNEIDKVMEIWLEGNSSAHGFLPMKHWLELVGDVRRSIEASHVFVDIRLGEVSGFIAFNDGVVSDLYVKAPFRSYGIGRELLEQAKSLNESLALLVFMKNFRAVDFCHREGFFIDDETIDETTGEMKFLMRWFKCPNFEAHVIDVGNRVASEGVENPRHVSSKNEWAKSVLRN